MYPLSSRMFFEPESTSCDEIILIFDSNKSEIALNVCFISLWVRCLIFFPFIMSHIDSRFCLWIIAHPKNIEPNDSPAPASSHPM